MSVTFNEVITALGITADDVDAIRDAVNPSATNVFMTQTEIPTELDDLDDVIFGTLPATGEFMRHNGSEWVNEPICPADVPEAGVTQYAAAIVHGDLQAASLLSDDHPHYVLVDGTRSFTGTVGGVMPTDASHLSTKEYTDLFTLGLIPILEVEAATDANTILSGIQIIDKHNPVDGDRILLLDQSDPTENGVWLMRPGAWTRPIDFLAGSSASRKSVFVDIGKNTGQAKGTDFSGQRFVCISPSGSDVVGTDALTFARHDGANELQAGRGLVREGNRLAIRGGNGIAAAENYIFVQENEIDHGSLNPTSLDGDHHSLYVPHTGVRGFTAPVAGKDPVGSQDLVTKSYVDGLQTILTDNELDAIQGASSPSAANVFATVNDLAGLGTGTDTLTCPPTIAVNDLVYIDADDNVARAGSDVHEAEAIVISKPNSTTCVVDYVTKSSTGFTFLSASAGTPIFLGLASASPNVVVTPPTDGFVQYVGVMVNSDKIRYIIRTDFEL